jgi:hypothetical protein
MKNGGRVARTAGLVITTSISAAAISNSNFDGNVQALLLFLTILISAFLAAMAADFDGETK